MSIESNNEIFTPSPEAHEGLINQVFSVGDRQSLNVSENINPRELLEKNALLVNEISAHADRIATAALRTLSNVPEHLQLSFMDGISCYNDKDDVVYNAVRQQWQENRAQV